MSDEPVAVEVGEGRLAEDGGERNLWTERPVAARQSNDEGGRPQSLAAADEIPVRVTVEIRDGDQGDGVGRAADALGGCDIPAASASEAVHIAASRRGDEIRQSIPVGVAGGDDVCVCGDEMGAGILEGAVAPAGRCIVPFSSPGRSALKERTGRTRETA